MPNFKNIYIWKKAPFLRLLLPGIAGIILQYYFSFTLKTIIAAAVILFLVYIIFISMPLAYRFKWQMAGGIIISFFILNAGAFITWQKDIRNHSDWYGNPYSSRSYIVATIDEPPVEKNKTYKVLAIVDAIINGDSVYNSYGKLILYFKKDTSIRSLSYGKKIILRKQLQVIRNSGNPGAFNYARYCAFKQIYHQCYLSKSDWTLLQGSDVSNFRNVILKTRRYIINVLNKYIKGNDESALAKALLIGYKTDLDKDLVQAYTNAGVVHLIAISGLHMALIYGILLLLTSKITFLKKSKLLKLLLILSSLWFFAILTGASASVLRAAVMFSFIALGTTFNKNSSIYNSLAASAFLLLCIDPFLLWDVGFQLSYCAVLGIVITQRYIFNWFYFQNKLVRKIWKVISVSIAAQVFTLPICIFYFHQVPLLFLTSNLIAIPLAAVVLWSCIILIFVSPIPVIAIFTGKIIWVLIWLLNHTVLFINNLPFSLWDGISISFFETFLLYSIIISILYWLLKKNKFAFKAGIAGIAIFTGIFALKNWKFTGQKKFIVYDIPSHKAIDFVEGNSYQFVGDSDLTKDGLLQNFHLKPARISYMVDPNTPGKPELFQKNNFYQFHNKKILMIDTTIVYKPIAKKINVDYIVISKNPKLYISQLAEVFNCNLYIFDSSNPMWKIDKWKKDCEELHLPFHSVPEQGAFITDL
jgi:competence protein ComEC